MSNKKAFWNLTLAEVNTELGVVGDGLSSEQAQARFLLFGPNQVDAAPRRSIIVQFLSRLLLLSAASSVMGVTGDVTGCLIIAVIVILSVTLDFLQETQAGKVVDALRKSIAVHAQAIRDGKPADLPVAEPLQSVAYAEFLWHRADGRGPAV